MSIFTVDISIGEFGHPVGTLSLIKGKYRLTHMHVCIGGGAVYGKCWNSPDWSVNANSKIIFRCASISSSDD